MAVVDVQMARELTGALINLNHCTEQFLYAHTIFKRSWYHWCTKQSTQCVNIHMVATTLKLVIHIECTHHAYVHINQLSG